MTCINQTARLLYVKIVILLKLDKLMHYKHRDTQKKKQNV